MRQARHGLALRLALAALVVAALVFGVVAVRLWPSLVDTQLALWLARVRGWGALGWLVFAALQVVVVVVGVLPASLVGIAAGAMFGVLPGFGLATVGTLVGAWLSFRLSRSLFRPLVERFVRGRPRLRAIDRAVATDGWKFVCLIRISPVMPFAATSYVLALSSIGERDYHLGTLAALPALFGYVCIGALADAGLAAWRGGAGPLQWVLLAAGLAATVVLTLRVGRIALRALPAGDDAASR